MKPAKCAFGLGVPRGHAALEAGAAGARDPEPVAPLGVDAHRSAYGPEITRIRTAARTPAIHATPAQRTPTA